MKIRNKSAKVTNQGLYVLLESQFLNMYQNTIATIRRNTVRGRHLSDTEAILKGLRLEGYILTVLPATGATYTVFTATVILFISY